MKKIHLILYIIICIVLLSSCAASMNNETQLAIDDCIKDYKADVDVNYDPGWHYFFFTDKKSGKLSENSKQIEKCLIQKYGWTPHDLYGEMFGFGVVPPK